MAEISLFDLNEDVRGEIFSHLTPLARCCLALCSRTLCAQLLPTIFFGCNFIVESVKENDVNVLKWAVAMRFPFSFSAISRWTSTSTTPNIRKFLFETLLSKNHFAVQGEEYWKAVGEFFVGDDILASTVGDSLTLPSFLTSALDGACKAGNIPLIRSLLKLGGSPGSNKWALDPAKVVTKALVHDSVPILQFVLEELKFEIRYEDFMDYDSIFIFEGPKTCDYYFDWIFHYRRIPPGLEPELLLSERRVQFLKVYFSRCDYFGGNTYTLSEDKLVSICEDILQEWTLDACDLALELFPASILKRVIKDARSLCNWLLVDQERLYHILTPKNFAKLLSLVNKGDFFQAVKAIEELSTRLCFSTCTEVFEELLKNGLEIRDDFVFDFNDFALKDNPKQRLETALMAAKYGYKEFFRLFMSNSSGKDVTKYLLRDIFQAGPLFLNEISATFSEVTSIQMIARGGFPGGNLSEGRRTQSNLESLVFADPDSKTIFVKEICVAFDASFRSGHIGLSVRFSTVFQHLLEVFRAFRLSLTRRQYSALSRHPHSEIIAPLQIYEFF